MRHGATVAIPRNVSTLPSATNHDIAARPTVTVSYAQTLDGRLATRTGSSQWISGPESLHFAHQLRAEHDAIMVGVGTVLRDNPRLTARLGEISPERASPLRVIVDSRLRTPLTSSVLAGGASRGTLLATTSRGTEDRRAVLTEMGAEVLVVEGEDRQVDLTQLLSELSQRGIGSVMVEGGARLITSLLRDHLVDRLAVCIAPMILGVGIEAIGDLGIADLARSLRLVDPAITMYGVDLLIDGRVAYPEDADDD